MRSTGPAHFWLAFAFLNAVLGVRFPEREPWPRLFMPSLDLIALLVVLALWGAFRAGVHRALHRAVLGGLLAARVLRIADGVEQGAYLRNFNFSVDLPLLAELARLLASTLPGWTLALVALAVPLGLALLLFLMHRALRVAEVAMAAPSQVRAFSLLLAGLALSSVFLPAEAVFRPSAFFWRLRDELAFAWGLPDYRAAHLARIDLVQQRLGAGPHDLRKLRGQNVYLFLIESYGQCALDVPALFAQIGPEYTRFESELGRAGFGIVSRVLDSPTYGGRSWLAQATLLTSVPTRDQLQFELLRAAQPQSLAELFGAAGYRTVLAQPGTVRESSVPDLYHFEQHYFARDFAYQGPRFGWATMPDQFVLDFVRRRERPEAALRPLLLVQALVSSHVPWSELPPWVDDWSALGDGAVYRHLPARHYETGWLSLSGAGAAYADAIVYDLRLLRRYIAEFITDDSLVIVLGDHQPHSDVSAKSPWSGVPIHVLSRNAALIDPFRARGYTPGMLAHPALSHPGLDSLMLDLAADFSVDPATAGQVR